MKRIPRFLAALLFLVMLAPTLTAQTTVRAPSIVTDTQTLAITTATADTVPVASTGAQTALVQFKFGTVTGTYTTCTVQAKTSIDGTNFLLLSTAASVTVTSSTNNSWFLTAAAPASGNTSVVSTTASRGFGQLTKFTFACSGAYGTSVTATVSVTFSPEVLSAAGAGGGGGGGEVTNGGVFAVQVDAAIPAGNNNIGDVDVVTVPADPFGANADAAVAAGASGSIQAKLRRISQGLEDLKSLVVLAAGTNVIGHVINDASSAVIGHVIADSGSTTAVTGTVTLAALPAGSNVIGHVINDASSAVIGHVIVDSGGGGGSTAQGASTSGVTGGMSMGSVTTSAPTYATATTNALSLNTAGGLRVAPTTLDAAEGATLTTTPVPVGCEYNTIANVATLTDGQAGYFACGPNKELVTSPYSTRTNDLAGLITTAMTGTTSTAVTGMGAQGSGIKNYVTGCVVSNSHASVGTDVVLQDGSGGSTLWTFPAGIAYGGTAYNFPTPIHTTANTALYAADVTTGASVKLSCTGFKGK